MKFSKQSDSEGISWYLRRGSKVRGPFPSGTLRQLVAAERVLLTDEASRDRKQWTKVSALDELLPPNLRSAQRPSKLSSGAGLPRPFEDPPPFPWVPLLVSMGVVIGTIGLFITLDPGSNAELPDCNQAPAPGVNWSNCQLPGINLEQRDLAGLRANNSDLSGANLTGANLRQAYLQYANLILADLSYTDLSGASLKGATLRQADLSNADLTGANLSFADLSQANLANAKLDDAIWSSGKRCAASSIGTCR